MTTQEIVDQLVNYINTGKNLEAEQALYADSVVSYEQDGTMASGLEAVMAKTKGAMEMFEAFHAGGVTKAYVGSDSFILEFFMDVTPKGGERMQFTELGFYKLADGKVVEEYFYAQPKTY
jgi:hypothetical protein